MTPVTSAHHALDSSGVPLPDGSWPDQPGAGGALDIVRRLCNSINRQHGGEAWRDVDELGMWLRREGYDVGRLTPRDLDELLALRDAMWRSITGRSIAPLASALEHLRFRPVVDDHVLRLVAEGSMADIVAGRLVAVVVDAQTTGAWDRVKACAQCSWVFIDASRNRSGRWCSMSACGGREKARAYRARRRTGGSGT
ncbi:MAG: hypothetical protein FD127_3895 [Acidimicrobiaceae bacterium]|nr:MAG: hypothetical protein FD127_3895 [Acidimicrobiaceae bacterium]